MVDRIARARMLGNLTQAELARRLGVSQAKVNAWESGRHKVRREMLMDIADALGVGRAWLAGAGPRVRYGGRFCEIVRTAPGRDGGAVYTLDRPGLGFFEAASPSEIA